MRFEDYNYNMYNPYILIDSQKGAKLQAQGYGNMSKMGSETGPRLTEQQLEASICGDYDFDLNNAVDGDKPPEDKAEAPKPAEVAPAEKKADGEEEEEAEEEEGDDGDEEEFNLFFDRDEIESTKDMQVFDAFQDLKENRKEWIFLGTIGNKTLNKISIEEFAPREEDIKANQNLKKVKGRRDKGKPGSQNGDQPEDLALAEAEVDDALEQQRLMKIEAMKEEQKNLKNEIEELIKQDAA
jgi:hypothetical protein